jgi:hypothetical protein
MPGGKEVVEGFPGVGRRTHGAARIRAVVYTDPLGPAVLCKDCIDGGLGINFSSMGFDVAPEGLGEFAGSAFGTGHSAIVVQRMPENKGAG